MGAVIIDDETGGTTWTWQGAREYCQTKIKTDFFAINSKVKSLRLRALGIENNLEREAWTGLNDEATPGTWVWIDGSPTNDWFEWTKKNHPKLPIPFHSPLYGPKLNHRFFWHRASDVANYMKITPNAKNSWRSVVGTKALSAFICKS